MARNTIGTTAYVPALLMEFVVTFLFNFAGVGAAMAAEKLNGDPLVGLFFVAMAHALAVAVLMSAGFPISGGHLNPAVTFGLLADGHIKWARTLLYWFDQCLASVAASALLTYLTGGLTPPVHSLGSGVGAMQGVIMEFVLTFSLLFTVFATLVDSERGHVEGLGPLLTGLVVGANIMAGGSFSGASMNPARSFGPALVSWNWTNHWIYWVGPLIGGGLAGNLYGFFYGTGPYIPVTSDEPL